MHMDPQQCLFLEACWHALEDAGYNPYTYPGAVAVFGGTRLSTYYVNYHVPPTSPNTARRASCRAISARTGTTCARASPTSSTCGGPAFNGAVRLLHFPGRRCISACQGLLNGECDMALAGASGIDIPAGARPFLPGRHDLFAPDGHCRPYDAAGGRHRLGAMAWARFSLKRLEDAIERPRLHSRGHPGDGHQQRRQFQGRLFRAQPRRPERSHRRGPGRQRRRSRHHRLCGRARHGHLSGRSRWRWRP